MPRPTSHGSRSTRRTACIAKPAISRTRSKTLIGLYPRAAADRTIQTCSGRTERGRTCHGTVRSTGGPVRTAVALDNLLRPAVLAAFVGAVLAATPVVVTPAGAKPAGGKPQTAATMLLCGVSLAARQSQNRRVFANADKFYEKAFADLPYSAE